MPRITKPLTDTEIRKAKAKDKQYNLSDGDGLQLRISTKGVKSWFFNYYRPITNKRNNLSLGRYPDLSLANARTRAAEARELVANGIDPAEHKQTEAASQRLAKSHTFAAITTEWLKVKRSKVKTATADKAMERVKLHLIPVIGKRPIKELTRQEVIASLRPLEAEGKLETIKRLCQLLNQIMTFAANAGYVQANNLHGINEAFEKPKPKHMAALPPDELPRLMQRVYAGSCTPQTRRMIELQLLTLARPGEMAEARWSEFDLENAIWEIPPERMKMGRSHKIPLPAFAIELLKVQHQISGHKQYLFTNRRDPTKPANSQTVNAALKRMGFKGELVSHGLRSTASTALNEQGFEADIIEVALAHLVGSQVAAIYNRAEYLERRRIMMEWWGRCLQKAIAGEFKLTGTGAIEAA